LAATANAAWACDTNYGQYYYIRSNVAQPWGQSTNEAAMDETFGSGQYCVDYYETVSLGDLFATATKFIFFEGGDSSFLPFQNFINSNSNSLYTWVNNGGRALIMSAPNDPLQGASLYLPDNVLLSADAFYGSAASSAQALDVSFPIFTGPSSTTTYFTGDFFAHGYFSGDNLVPIMRSDLNETVLGYDQIGSGLMVVGGMTTDNFQLPQPAAHYLLDNIIYFTAMTNLD
jgi:hypothetical protein